MSRFFRIAGVSVTLLMVLAGYWFFRPAPRSPDSGTALTAPKQGGQLVATVRAEPRSFNRIAVRTASADLLSHLTQGRLVRVNRSTFELEPWLAERWETNPDGLSHTLHLRDGVSWSDGTPFTAEDVVFSFRAGTDPGVSAVASSLMAGGKPITVQVVDSKTVRVDFAGPLGPGLRVLDALPILPRHKLESAYTAGMFQQAWSMQTPPADIVGLGPFVFASYEPGQRVVLERNPRYWRTAADGTRLPYLDRIVLEVVPDQNAELLRLQAGASDLLQDEIRSDDYVTMKKSEAQGTVKLVELGVSPAADGLWFCMKPDKKKADPRFAFVQRKEFRQALSHAVDREAFAQTVFLGEAVPVWGPITPGNKEWFTPNLPRYAPDAGKAKALLASIGLEDRNGNGIVEDAKGTEARFTVITQRGLGWYERGMAVIVEEAAKIGVALEVAPLENGAMIQRLLACDYDAIYMRALSTDLDPAANLDFWLSSGSAHLWNLEQKKPATEWEAELDRIMAEQASTPNPGKRRALFIEAQRLFADQLPALYFAAPRTYSAHSTRLRGVVPSVLRPPVLWNADSLSLEVPAAAASR
jgi:peptide/nickel transport system substrate-binding protein